MSEILVPAFWGFMAVFAILAIMVGSLIVIAANEKGD